MGEVFRELSANISTYWKDFQGFDGTTVSECDKRIRNFLSLPTGKSGRIISLCWKKKGRMSRPGSFCGSIMKRLKRWVGGSYKKLEEGVWLIQADSNNVILNLKSSETQKYY